MRCMMVHSVSTREVGSLPPSLSRACVEHDEKIKSACKLSVQDRMMLDLPCRRRAAGYEWTSGILTCSKCFTEVLSLAISTMNSARDFSAIPK